MLLLELAASLLSICICISLYLPWGAGPCGATCQIQPCGHVVDSCDDISLGLHYHPCESQQSWFSKINMMRKTRVREGDGG